MITLVCPARENQAGPESRMKADVDGIQPRVQLCPNAVSERRSRRQGYDKQLHKLIWRQEDLNRLTQFIPLEL